MSVNYIGSLDVCASDVPKKPLREHILRSQLNFQCNAEQRVHSDNKRGMQSSRKWHLFFLELKPKHTSKQCKAKQSKAKWNETDAKRFKNLKCLQFWRRFFLVYLGQFQYVFWPILMAKKATDDFNSLLRWMALGVDLALQLALQVRSSFPSFLLRQIKRLHLKWFWANDVLAFV